MDHHLDQLTKFVTKDFQWADPGNGSPFDDGVVHQDPGSFAPFYNVNSEVEFMDDQEKYPMLNYINQILMEENLMEQPSVDYDPLALLAAEKSFYDVLANYDPSLPRQASVDSQSSTGFTRSGSSSKYAKNRSISGPCNDSDVIASGNGSSSQHATSASIDPCIDDNVIASRNGSAYEHVTYASVNPCVDGYVTRFSDLLSRNKLQPFSGTSQLATQRGALDLSKKPISKRGKKMETSVDSKLMSTVFADKETVLQFKRGLEEGNKFLPTSQLFVDLDKYALPSKSEGELAAKSGKNLRKGVVPSSRGRKQQYQDYYDDSNHGRSCKHSAVYEEDAVELSETFDRVLLYGDSEALVSSSNADERLSVQVDETFQENVLLHRINNENGHAKKTEAVDLVSLLLSCAQSIAADDLKTANEQLKQIRQYASSTGDQYQRLAAIFANALVARLTGTGPDLYAAQISKRVSAAEELKAMRVYLCAPIKQMASFLTNRMIMDAASNSNTLHIVDFGISYGFQWPSFIQLLSNRPGGPPKLRITGIDSPQPGFRPAEKLEDTGRRLARYCERFDVPFEYKTLAIRNWETIRVEDLSLSRNEVVAVNCQLVLKNLLNETTGNENPRDAVLSVIRKMKPDIFINSCLNGLFGSSFFLTRFREALFFFSTIFDCLDTNLPRDDLQRVKFETNFLGLEVLNIVACEGSARVERPETYKQWQVRYIRAGFRILPLNPYLMRELKTKTKEGYHKDFMLDEDNNWMLLGWKGKVISASSCWVPA